MGGGGDRCFVFSFMILFQRWHRTDGCVNLPEAKTGGGFPSSLSTSVLKSGILRSSYVTTSLQNM